MTGLSIAMERRRLRAPLGLLPDERLARLAARGDQQAFATIYERHHQGLYRYCRSILANAEDAEDALHNVMNRVLRALPGEKREIALKPWLYRIAHNESLRMIGARRAQVEIDEAFELPGADVEAQRARRERLRQLVADLRGLPERQRGVLLMRELSGLDYAEIASAFAISEAAAKQTVYEARNSLRDFEQGREMDCNEVARLISIRDGRLLRERKVRAHLRHCQQCREFKAALRGRKADLDAIAPPLAAPVAAALLLSVQGGAGGAKGAGLVGLIGGTGGKAAVTATAVKGIAAATTALILGSAAIGIVHGAGIGLPWRPANEATDGSSARKSSAQMAPRRARVKQVDERDGKSDRKAPLKDSARRDGQATPPGPWDPPDVSGADKGFGQPQGPSFERVPPARSTTPERSRAPDAIPERPRARYPENAPSVATGPGQDQPTGQVPLPGSPQKSIPTDPQSRFPAGSR